MSTQVFPASAPRRRYWSTEIGGHVSCPECRGRLRSDSHTYLMGVRRGGETQLLMAGNDAGYFCAKCPVVVLDKSVFEEFAALAMRSSRNVEFAVLGIVDLDAVPKDKRHLPFDEVTNPVPVVKFTNLGTR